MRCSTPSAACERAEPMTSSEMDDSERLVGDYLKHRGFTNVVFHPDGRNSPPDFLINGRVAVEVRRLNQNKESASGAHGLEESAISLAAVVRKVLQTMGPPAAGVSWFVFYNFRRPLPRWKDLERALTVALTNCEWH